jgi:Acyltransferase family
LGAGVVEERVTITARETVVTRNAAADRLKVVLVCAVIVAHCAITYGADGGWFYHEGGDASVLADVLTVPLALGALFAMGAFFYVAGCFVPSSLDRKGIRRFAAERAVRLGIPVAAYVCVVVPAIEWLVAVTAGPRRTAADIWSDQLHELDAGPLWFAAALLIFSVAYATFTSLRRIPVSTTPLRVRTLLVCAATIAVLSFVLRIWFPIDTFQIGALHVWQWGQCLGLFALGAFLGQRGLTTFDHRVVVTCRWLLGIGALAVLLLIAAYSDKTDPLGGGAALAIGHRRGHRGDRVRQRNRRAARCAPQMAGPRLGRASPPRIRRLRAPGAGHRRVRAGAARCASTGRGQALAPRASIGGGVLRSGRTATPGPAAPPHRLDVVGYSTASTGARRSRAAMTTPIEASRRTIPGHADDGGRWPSQR